MKAKYVWPVVGVWLSACAAAESNTVPVTGNIVSTAADAATTTDSPMADAGLPAMAALDAGAQGTQPAVDADTPSRVDAFPVGMGVSNAIERSAPCSAAEVGMFRNAPESHETIQACLPNYGIWAVVVCGGPQPPCSCEASRCASGEVAKQVSDAFCVCMSPCNTQMSDARCGEGDGRACIPIDDATGEQVFICGGS